MTAKRFTLGEVGCYRTSLIVNDGRKMGNKEVVDVLNALHEENINLKQALWEAEEEYLHEAYNDNPIRLNDKIIDLKEEWDREYWND